MNITKVTDPRYAWAIRPHMIQYVDILGIPGLTQEGFIYYVGMTVQKGGKNAEFHIAHIDKEPYGFGLWGTMGPPHISKSHFDHLYIWRKHKGLTTQFIEKFLDYSKREKCVYMDVTALDKARFKFFEKFKDKFNCEIIQNGKINFIARRKV